MKTFVETPDEPYQIFVKLPDGTMKEQTSHACAHCKMIRPDRDAALRCCKQWHCDTCGGKTYEFYTRCEACKDAAREEAATEVPDNGGPVSDGEEYWETMDAYLDAVDPEDRVECLMPCDVQKLSDERIDAADILENVLSDHHEDAYDRLVDVPELQEVLDAWMSKQTVESWSPIYNKRVRVPDDAGSTAAADAGRVAGGDQQDQVEGGEPPKETGGDPAAQGTTPSDS